MTLLFVSGITINCYFSLFNLKISDYLQLHREQTDCVQLASIVGVAAKIVNVIIYNYMAIVNEIQSGKSLEEQQFDTSFGLFYKSMLQVKFFRNYYNLLTPILLVVVGLTFALLGFFKYNSKHLDALLLFAQNHESGMSLRQQRQVKMQNNQSFLQKVLLGERAIINEYESIKVKH